MKTIIIGAGITGLSCAYKHGYTIFEENNVAGGICRTYRKNGYMFENGGGHWIFGANKNTYDLLDTLNIAYDKYKKKTGVYFNTVIKGQIQDVINNYTPQNNGSMRDWLYNRFGPELFSIFFDPFNKKYTNGLYEQIEIDNEYKNPIKDTKSYNNTFIYPTNGLDSLITEMERRCDIAYNHKLYEIDMEKKEATFLVNGENTTKVKYDKIISTIPLNKLLAFCNIEYDLLFTSTNVLNIGADKGPNFPKEQWLYVPFSKSGFYRIGCYSNVNPVFAKGDTCSLYIESIPKHSNKQKKDIIKELQSNGIIKRIHAISENNIHVSYTYQKCRHTVDEYIKKLADTDIVSTGRYGKWKFQGIAESINDGMEAI